MQKIRRLLALFLSVTMVLTSFTIPTFASSHVMAAERYTTGVNSIRELYKDDVEATNTYLKDIEFADDNPDAKVIYGGDSAAWQYVEYNSSSDTWEEASSTTSDDDLAVDTLSCDEETWWVLGSFNEIATTPCVQALPGTSGFTLTDKEMTTQDALKHAYKEVESPESGDEIVYAEGINPKHYFYLVYNGNAWEDFGAEKAFTAFETDVDNEVNVYVFGSVLATNFNAITDEVIKFTPDEDITLQNALDIIACRDDLTIDSSVAYSGLIYAKEEGSDNLYSCVACYNGEWESCKKTILEDAALNECTFYILGTVKTVDDYTVTEVTEKTYDFDFTEKTLTSAQAAKIAHKYITEEQDATLIYGASAYDDTQNDDLKSVVFNDSSNIWQEGGEIDLYLVMVGLEFNTPIYVVGDISEYYSSEGTEDIGIVYLVDDDMSATNAKWIANYHLTDGATDGDRVIYKKSGNDYLSLVYQETKDKYVEDATSYRLCEFAQMIREGTVTRLYVLGDAEEHKFSNIEACTTTITVEPNIEKSTAEIIATNNGITSVYDDNYVIYKDTGSDSYKCIVGDGVGQWIVSIITFDDIITKVKSGIKFFVIGETTEEYPVEKITKNSYLLTLAIPDCTSDKAKEIAAAEIDNPNDDDLFFYCEGSTSTKFKALTYSSGDGWRTVGGEASVSDLRPASETYNIWVLGTVDSTEVTQVTDFTDEITLTDNELTSEKAKVAATELGIDSADGNLIVYAYNEDTEEYSTLISDVGDWVNGANKTLDALKYDLSLVDIYVLGSTTDIAYEQLDTNTTNIIVPVYNANKQAGKTYAEKYLTDLTKDSILVYTSEDGLYNCLEYTASTTTWSTEPTNYTILQLMTKVTNGTDVYVIGEEDDEIIYYSNLGITTPVKTFRRMTDKDTVINASATRWYIDKDITFSDKTLIIKGENAIDIIIADDAKLEVNGHTFGIDKQNIKKLTFWGETEGTGELLITAKLGYPGIGTSTETTLTGITFYGITSTITGGDNAAGIGGGNNADVIVTNIVFKDGTTTIYSGISACCIGGFSNDNSEVSNIQFCEAANVKLYSTFYAFGNGETATNITVSNTLNLYTGESEDTKTYYGFHNKSTDIADDLKDCEYFETQYKGNIIIEVSDDYEDIYFDTSDMGVYLAQSIAADVYQSPVDGQLLLYAKDTLSPSYLSIKYYASTGKWQSSAVSKSEVPTLIKSGIPVSALGYNVSALSGFTESIELDDLNISSEVALELAEGYLGKTSDVGTEVIYAKNDSDEYKIVYYNGTKWEVDTLLQDIDKLNEAIATGTKIYVLGKTKDIDYEAITSNTTNIVIPIYNASQASAEDYLTKYITKGTNDIILVYTSTNGLYDCIEQTSDLTTMKHYSIEELIAKAKSGTVDVYVIGSADNTKLTLTNEAGATEEISAYRVMTERDKRIDDSSSYWYVKNDITYSDKDLRIFGDDPKHIIIANDATLTVNGDGIGIDKRTTAPLTFQSENSKEATGKLIVTSLDDYPAIGTTKCDTLNDITFRYLSAQITSETNAAAIGAGVEADVAVQGISFIGGNAIIQAGLNAAGIGTYNGGSKSVSNISFSDNANVKIISDIAAIGGNNVTPSSVTVSNTLNCYVGDSEATKKNYGNHDLSTDISSEIKDYAYFETSYKDLENGNRVLNSEIDDLYFEASDISLNMLKSLAKSIYPSPSNGQIIVYALKDSTPKYKAIKYMTQWGSLNVTKDDLLNWISEGKTISVVGNNISKLTAHTDALALDDSAMTVDKAKEIAISKFGNTSSASNKYVVFAKEATAGNYKVVFYDEGEWKEHASLTLDGINALAQNTIDTVYVVGIDTPEEPISVTYNSNGAISGAVPTDSTDYYKPYNITTKTNSGNLAKTGYTFTGWNTKADGTGTHYAVNTEITYTGTTDLTLYAEWTINTYTVTFNSVGGSEVQSQVINYNEKVSEPACTKEGYTLLGWYKESTYVTKWDMENDKVTTDMTLYAKWQVSNHTVTFETNGGSAVASQTVKHGEKVNAPIAPTKTGYTFDAWYADDTLMTPWLFNVNVIEADTTIYAGWSEIKVTEIQLDKSGINLFEDSTDKITATVLPSTALNKKLTWTSSNEEVVTVDNTGNLTAIKAGNATITVKSADGTVTATCEVIVTEKIDIATADIKCATFVYYTGSEVKPQVTVEVDGEKLTEGTHYTLRYEDNVKRGQAKVIITGTGIYAGEVTKTFTIISQSSGGGGSSSGGSSSTKTQTSTGNTYTSQSTSYFTGTRNTPVSNGNWTYNNNQKQYKTTEQFKNTWGYLTEKGTNNWYYFDSNGNAVTGWAKIDNVWYYFNPSGDYAGQMKTDWLLDSNNTWYHLDKTQTAKEGSMTTGWYNDDQDGNTYYLDKTSGAMLVGWQEIEGKSYYFNKVSTSRGWNLNFEGNWQFNQAMTGIPYGAMLKNTVTPDGKTVGADGALINNGSLSGTVSSNSQNLNNTSMN